jgi:5-(carboxyamino)imidazole ribonucleotide synthase
MGKRIGIVGGGQLGRMLTIPAKKLGFSVNIIDPTPNSPAGQIADHQIVADFKDEKAIRELGKISDYLTFEIELANSEVLKELEKKGIKINPSPESLAIIRDKLKQKEFLRKNQIATADFIEVIRKEEIIKIAKKFGYPILLKARFDAYDGRGNALIKNEQEIDSGLEKLSGRRIYVEKFVPFIKELAVVAVRSSEGKILTYPVVETMHKNNILHYLLSPAPISKKIADQAEKLTIQTMKHLKGAGVFGIEMFLTKDGKVLINEISPRVHNSGHHTIEANKTSQFENHIRAISNMPLGSTEMTAKASVMMNILGDKAGAANPRGIEKAEKIPGVKVHIYGKLETKPDRKMGHITVVGDSIEECLRKAKQARKLINI